LNEDQFIIEINNNIWVETHGERVEELLERITNMGGRRLNIDEMEMPEGWSIAGILHNKSMIDIDWISDDKMHTVRGSGTTFALSFIDAFDKIYEIKFNE
jgi:hypothetical protein